MHPTPRKFAIVWFRNDLRLHDHEALTRSVEKYQAKVLPVFCFDPRTFGKTHYFRFPKTGPYRAKFLLESVHNLRNTLRSINSDLIVRVGFPEKVIPELLSQLQNNNNSNNEEAVTVEEVYCHKEICDEEVKVEKSLKSALDQLNCKLHLFWGAMTMYHIDDLPFRLDGKSSLEVFTQFRKRIENSSSKVRHPVEAPKQLAAIPSNIECGAIPSLKDLMSIEDNQDFLSEFYQQFDGSPLNLDELEQGHNFVSQFIGGESVALKRLHEYIWEKQLIKVYKETRNGLLGFDYSSKFAPWLALGCLSPREIYHQVKKFEKQVEGNESTYWLIFELLWRDYFKFIGIKHGNDIFHLRGLKRPYEFKKWDVDMQKFSIWAKGQTGFPFVDANMRELCCTGFMSNRGRQNVASFLTKDLHIDWRMGAEFFESFLIDYDTCSNYGNWLYVAGVGNDPREDRYFNVIKQAHMYDAKAEYVKFWLPILQKIPDVPDLVHQPSLMSKEQLTKCSVVIGKDYPQPVAKVAFFKEKSNLKPKKLKH